MAIDTAQKRASLATVANPWNGPSIIPDGSLDQGDRQQVGWSYSGILAAAPLLPFALEIEELSLSRFGVLTESVPRYPVAAQSTLRYPVVVQSKPRYPAADQSTPRYGVT